MAYLALFVALGGTAMAATQIITDPSQIADNVIQTNHIKDGTIQAQDIGFGQVGTANLASGSVTASQLYGQSVTTSALRDGAVTSAKIAPQAVGNAQLGLNSVNTGNIRDSSVAPQDLVIDANHPFTYGSGAFQFTSTPCGTANLMRCEWANGASTFANSKLAVFVDPAGVVHLKGNVCYASRYSFQAPGSGGCATNDDDQSSHPVTNLPPGYRPPDNEQFCTQGYGTFAQGCVEVHANGDVIVDNASYASLDGITFRNR